MTRRRKGRAPLPPITWQHGRRDGADARVAELAGLRVELVRDGLGLTATIKQLGDGVELVREAKQCRDADHADFMAARAIDRLELELHRAHAKRERAAAGSRA